ncbi:NAD-dependent methanol dehydrogenase [Eubacterium callanderi]|uniref:iron-containing alcohol dehydrogenase family protein n=1 Tax=Eubacterium callanderi TaxID=53442 RepID=UPI0029FF274D|nr:iron-containing alcohol dehydrogenase [Eubacterium callanderi]WPK69233.1 NAD-dependent methanol dehydrogenase [Eubacterium callanderi]WPK73531.1 NAD-dependent methanol dehydrogenase [Eubacterium callanderi]
MKEFNFYLPVKILFGEGIRNKVAQEAKVYGIKKPLIITDSFLKETEWGKLITEQFYGAVVFDKVIPNPTIASVNECADYFKKNNCDGIVAFGGGSTLDTAKACATLAYNNESIAVFFDGNGENKQIASQYAPIIAIPSTSGTGSEVSQYAVITDEKTKIKDSITSVGIYPKVALIDPEITWNLPKALTISTGLDVLSHAIESITSTIDNPLTDILAAEVIRIVLEWLPKCLQIGNKEARAQMAYASMLAGIAMSHCCGTLPHGMGCPLSGHCGVPHGLAVGVFQTRVLKMIEKQCDDHLKRAINYLDRKYESTNQISATDALIYKINHLFEELGYEQNLKEFNITDEQIKRMAEDALIHGCTSLTPVKISKDEIIKLYQEIQ